MFTSNELLQSKESWTNYIDGQWGKFCSEGNVNLSKTEAAKLFKESFNCTPAEFESYF